MRFIRVIHLKIDSSPNHNLVVNNNTVNDFHVSPYYGFLLYIYIRVSYLCNFLILIQTFYSFIKGQKGPV